MSKAIGINLPAYTTIDNILHLLETLKLKKKDDEVKAIFGKGGSAYTNTKSALRAFGFVENDSLEFTETGRQIAYSPDQEKKNHLTDIFKICTPYEIFLLSLLKSEPITATKLDDIVNVWGQANYGSTERNRQDAAKLFMSIIQYVELGKYIIGRGQNPTRIEWAPNIKDKIMDITTRKINDAPLPKECENTDMHKTEDLVKYQLGKSAEEESFSHECKSPEEKTAEGYLVRLSVSNQPNITINVDMSDWPDEKMRIFFKYIYGQFEGEQ